MLLDSVLEGWDYETNVEEGWQLPVTWIALQYSGQNCLGEVRSLEAIHSEN